MIMSTKTRLTRFGQHKSPNRPSLSEDPKHTWRIPQYHPTPSQETPNLHVHNLPVFIAFVLDLFNVVK